MLADLAVKPSLQSQNEAMLPKQPSLGEGARGEIVSFSAELGEAMGSSKGLARSELSEGREKSTVTDKSAAQWKDDEARQTRLRRANSLGYIEHLIPLGIIGQLANVVDPNSSLEMLLTQGKEQLDGMGVSVAPETQLGKTEQRDAVGMWGNEATQIVVDDEETRCVPDMDVTLTGDDALSLPGHLAGAADWAVSQAVGTLKNPIGEAGISTSGDGDAIRSYTAERVITGFPLPIGSTADLAIGSVLEEDALLALLQEDRDPLQTKTDDGTDSHTNGDIGLGRSSLLPPEVSPAPWGAFMGKAGDSRQSGRPVGRAGDDVDLLSTLLGQDAAQEESLAVIPNHSEHPGGAGLDARKAVSLDRTQVEEWLLIDKAMVETIPSGTPSLEDDAVMSRFASYQYGPEGGSGNLTLGVAANEPARDDLGPGGQDGTSDEVALGSMRESASVEPKVVVGQHFDVTTEELAPPLQQQGSLEEVAGIQAKNEKSRPTETSSEPNQGLSSLAFRQIRVSVAPKGEQDNTQGEAHAFENGSNMAEPNEVQSGHEVTELTQSQTAGLERTEGTPEKTKDATFNTKEVTRLETLLGTSLEQSPLVEEAGRGRPSPSVPVTVRQVVDQIVQKVELEMKGEYGEIRLQLKPEHLGELEIKIATNNGVVSAAFLAESKTVKGLIEAGLPHLKQQLMQQGLNIQDVSVEVGGGNSHGRQSYTGSADSNLSGAWYQGGAGTDTVGVTARPQQSLWGSTIDYRA